MAEYKIRNLTTETENLGLIVTKISITFQVIINAKVFALQCILAFVSQQSWQKATAALYVDLNIHLLQFFVRHTLLCGVFFVKLGLYYKMAYPLYTELNSELFEAQPEKNAFSLHQSSPPVQGQSLGLVCE